MVLPIKPTPTRFPTNILYTPLDNTPLHAPITLFILRMGYSRFIDTCSRVSVHTTLQSTFFKNQGQVIICPQMHASTGLTIRVWG